MRSVYSVSPIKKKLFEYYEQSLQHSLDKSLLIEKQRLYGSV
jgi:hypothetical protein